MQPPKCPSCGERHWQIEGCGILSAGEKDVIRRAAEEAPAVVAAELRSVVRHFFPTGLAAVIADSEAIVDALPSGPNKALAESLLQTAPIAAFKVMGRAGPDDGATLDRLALQAAEGQRLLSLRKSLKLSQPKFSAAFHVPVGTLRGWESGRHKMPPYFLALVTVIEREPKAVFRALGVKA